MEGHTQGHLKRNREDVLFRIPKTSYFRTRYREISMTVAHLSEIETKKTFILKEKRLDLLGRMIMGKTNSSSNSGERLYKAFVYVALITLAVVILVPVAWVFMASVKQNSEFYGNPWALPEGFYWQNFVDAWNSANMGSYMINSVVVTALALLILLIVALPAAYCLARFKFKGGKFLNTAFMAGLFINSNFPHR